MNKIVESRSPRQFHCWNVLVFLFLLSWHVPTSYAQSPPITLTGDFTLTSDITFAGTGFIVDADNITIDLNGHTITGPSSGFNIGVSIDRHNGVTVKNGTITGFAFGIILTVVEDNHIKGINITSNTEEGIFLGFGSINNEFEHINVTRTTGNGIFLRFDSDNNHFEHINVTSNRNGIVLDTDSVLLVIFMPLI